jgi:hypothetical protein
MSTNATALSAINNAIDALEELAEELTTPATNAKGTIVKAKSDQARFKPSSLWVSLGNGKYKHLTGKKGLITKHDRLDGFVDVVYQA